VETKKVLALDVSTKTGFAFMESSSSGIKLIDYGTLEQIHTPEGSYPGSFVKWAYLCFGEVSKLIEKYKADVIVIEETSAGSKAIYTQKILEYTHFLLAKFFVDNDIDVHYTKTEEWRRATGCIMSKEEKKLNAKVSKLKSKQKAEILQDESLTEEQREKKLKSVRAKMDGKIVGRTGRKHVNVRRANEILGPQLRVPLKKKDEDQADACLLAVAWHFGRLNG
jgi:Holliday junction resolvasome RuvABC endonuclease subunit